MSCDKDEGDKDPFSFLGGGGVPFPIYLCNNALNRNINFNNLMCIVIYTTIKCSSFT